MNFVTKVKKDRIEDIKKYLNRTGVYEEGDETIFVDRIIDKGEANLIRLARPSHLQQFIELLSSSVPETLPIDIYLDAPKEELSKIFNHDDKGWANNASGLINLLAYGTILYTGYGMCTDSEVLRSEKYSHALVLPEGQYGLKPGEKLSPSEEARGKRQHYDSSTKKRGFYDKKLMVRAEDIIEDIIARESENKNQIDSSIPRVLVSSVNNQSTFEQAGHLLIDQFSPDVIAQELIGYLNECFEKY